MLQKPPAEGNSNLIAVESRKTAENLHAIKWQVIQKRRPLSGIIYYPLCTPMENRRKIDIAYTNS